jgi:hypothetical protein
MSEFANVAIAAAEALIADFQHVSITRQNSLIRRRTAAPISGRSETGISARRRHIGL